jgi:hypothetical protein
MGMLTYARENVALVAGTSGGSDPPQRGKEADSSASSVAEFHGSLRTGHK